MAAARIKQAQQLVGLRIECLPLLLLIASARLVASQTTSSGATQAQIESQIGLTPRRAEASARLPLASKPDSQGAQHSASLLERLITSIDKLHLSGRPPKLDHGPNSSTKVEPNNHDSQQAFDHDNTEEPARQASSPSQAIDPLEVTTKLAELSIATHQYTLTGADSTTHPIASDQDEDALVLDSNNVTQTSSSQQQQASERPAKDVITCREAFAQCARREVCGPALRNFRQHCSDLVRNDTQTACNQKCLDAMIALRSTEESDSLMACDCEHQELCLKSKQKTLATCKTQVDLQVRDDTVVSCSTASVICGANQRCSEALGYYYANCQSLVSLRYCSPACNNSLSILYGQPKASKLINCQCDGSQDFACHLYKTLTERYCLNGESHLSNVSGDSSKHNNQFDDLLDPELLNNDSYLITNEHHDEARDFDDEFEPLSPPSFATDIDDESNNLDGFEPAEDTRTPIPGAGRFPDNMNKHHQQQQRQSTQVKQQQTRRKASRRGKNNNANHKTRESGTYNQEGKRSRHSRLMASTSSVGSVQLELSSILLNLSMLSTTAAVFIANHRHFR